MTPSHVRTSTGWFRVVRVDAATVTVATDLEDLRVPWSLVVGVAVDGRAVA